jgi:F0F1-type ATP synthase membrane subunit b/b'
VLTPSFLVLGFLLYYSFTKAIQFTLSTFNQEIPQNYSKVKASILESQR